MTTTVNNTVNSAAARTMNTIIEATALTKSFPITKREKELILKGIDFSVRPPGIRVHRGTFRIR